MEFITEHSVEKIKQIINGNPEEIIIEVPSHFFDDKNILHNVIHQLKRSELLKVIKLVELDVDLVEKIVKQSALDTIKINKGQTCSDEFYPLWHDLLYYYYEENPGKKQAMGRDIVSILDSYITHKYGNNISDLEII